MNAALLMMTSTIMAGADVAPSAPPASPPAVVAGPGCGTPGCGPVANSGCCDPCGSGRIGLLDRLRSRGGLHSSGCGCAPAPASCAPCATPAPCNDCASARPNLLDRLRAKHGKNTADCGCTGYAPQGCATALPPGAPPVQAPSAVPPQDMPKSLPKTTAPKVGGNGADARAVPPISIPSPGAVVIPSLPVTPVSGPKLNGTTSPY